MPAGLLLRTKQFYAMKKKILFTAWLLACCLAAVSAQNQKIIFPTPLGFEGSTAGSVRMTADGGYILTGTALDDVADDLAILPRIVKLGPAGQTEWDNLYLGNLSPRPFLRSIGAALEMPDGQYFIGLEDDSTANDLMRLDAAGNLLGAHAYPEFTASVRLLGLLPGGQALGVRAYFSGSWKTGIIHLDAAGNFAYSQQIAGIGASGADAVLLANGDVLFRTYNSQTQKFTLIRTDNQGNPLWQSAPAPGLNGHLVGRPDGGFAISYGNYAIRLFDAQGAVTDTTPVVPVLGTPNGLASYSDGSFLVSGQTVTNRGFMLRFQTDGTVVWSVESPGDNQPAQRNLAGFPTADGWAAGASDGGYPGGANFGFLRVQAGTGIFVNTLSGRVAKDNDESCAVEGNEPGIGHTQVTATNATGETWTAFSNGAGNYSMYLPAGDFTLATQTLYPFFFLCPTAPTAVSFPANAEGTATLDFPQQSQDLIHQIAGHLTLDENDNCTADAGEPALEDWHLRLVVGSQHINLDTDADGNYAVFVPDGDYQIQAEPFNFNYDFCGSPVANISLNSPTPASATADFVAFAETDCAILQPSVEIPAIRPCTTAQIKVHYRNNGTVAALDATLRVTLDPALNYLGAVPAPSITNGNTLWFEVGDILPTPGGGSSGGFVRINVESACDLPIGNQVCVSAHLEADAGCGPTPGWDGAITAVEGACVGDSAVFIIRNIGNAPHSQPLEFVIVEDQIVLLQGTFQLPPGGFQVESVLPLGIDTAVTIIAGQEPGYPGDTTVTFSLTNCNGGGSHPSGYGGSPGPGSAQACRMVTGSYDPNDKQAFPEGVGPEHVVQPGTPLLYTVRFQNTGTDTAFLVVIRDTLSTQLDPATLRVESASHAVEVFQFGNLVEFTFADILLPDSAMNAAESQGFVQFTVYPRADLPLGTVVDNRAAIYFDFNAPVLTNTVRRTYDNLFILVKTDEPAGGDANRLAVKIYPNPFRDFTTLELPADAPAGAYQLEMFDAAGRFLQKSAFENGRLTIRRADLPAGVLAWRLVRDGVVMATGRMVAVGE